MDATVTETTDPTPWVITYGFQAGQRISHEERTKRLACQHNPRLTLQYRFEPRDA